MTQPTTEQILSALDTVIWNDANIVARGMIAGVSLTSEAKGVKVNLIIQIEPSKSSDFDKLKQQIERAASGVAGVSSVAVVFTSHQAPQSGQERKPHVPQKISLPEVKYVVAIASGKGGVGKSTTSVNLAVAMMQKGLKVGLMDADIYGPSIPRMLGISGKPGVDENKKMIPHEKFDLKTMSMGFLIAEDAPMVWRGPMVHAAITQLFRDVAWGELDILIVDLPPGTGDAQLTMAQSAPLSGAVIVSTPQDIALIDARKGLAMFQKVGIPVLGMIENMSTFICPHCGTRSDIFSHGGAHAEAEKLHIPFLGDIPLHMSVREKSDAGTPLTIVDPESAIARQYQAIAAHLWNILTA